MANKRWLPLEANPNVMNTFSEALGLNTEVASFKEVYGVDPVEIPFPACTGMSSLLGVAQEMLAFVPRPVYAVLLLFPIDERSEEAKRIEEERIEREGQTVSPNVYFMKQTVGNACGTVAMLHAFLNCMERLPIREGSFISQFYERTREMTPEERANFLENPKEGDPDIEAAHHSAAVAGDTDAPPLEQKVNLHFVCLIEKYGSTLYNALDYFAKASFEGALYELDGRKKFPINHGISTSATLLEDAIRVAQVFMSRTTSIEFNIMALTG